MSRPIWKGHISFGLVNIPVILYSAEKNIDIQFKLIDSRDKSRIRYMRINEHTGKEVPWDAVAKGYEYDHKDYVLLKDSEIKARLGENTKTIEIENFVNEEELDFMDFDKPYYLVPDKKGKGEKGYVILRETLKNTKKVGITRVMIHTRQYLAALMPYENALVLNLMRYHQEIKKPSEFELPSENPHVYKITHPEMEIAKKLVASMSVKWNPKNYRDKFRETLHQLVEDKIHHVKSKSSKKKVKEPSFSHKNNIINFVDILKRSLENKKNPQVKKSNKKENKKFKKVKNQ